MFHTSRRVDCWGDHRGTIAQRDLLETPVPHIVIGVESKKGLHLVSDGRFEKIRKERTDHRGASQLG
jgi:hypothetical protein